METAGKHVDRESKAFEKLRGLKKHFCPDWDYMAIDEHSPEFEACTCENLPKEVKSPWKCPHCDGLGSYNCLCTGLAR